jgi:hypothetical protein
MKCKRIRLRENSGRRVTSRAQIGPDHVFYPGDGTRLHDRGLRSQACFRSCQISTSALAVLAPIRKDIVGWDRLRTRHFFESYDVMIQAGDRSALTGSR